MAPMPRAFAICVTALALTVGCALGAASAWAQSDPQTVANKAVVTEIVNQIINGRQIELADQLVAEDMVQHLNRETKGLAEYKAHYQKIFKRYKDYILDVYQIVADGEIVVVYGRLHGITNGGNKINFHVADIYRLSGGRLAERWHVEQLINK